MTNPVCTTLGVVVGVLDISGNVDIDQLNRIRTESEGMLLTFHRAIDVCSSYHEALEMIINCGCDRVLTSGQQRSALKGVLVRSQRLNI